MQNKHSTSFEIEKIDHVAIRVADMQASIKWYQKVLGLKMVHLAAWGDFPIFMLSGETGVALFPANLDHPKIDKGNRNVKIDHFAFRVTVENFANAQKEFREMSVPFVFQDHYYYHSIYLKDPDGHTVELTTQVKALEE